MPATVNGARTNLGRHASRPPVTWMTFLLLALLGSSLTSGRLIETVLAETGDDQFQPFKGWVRVRKDVRLRQGSKLDSSVLFYLTAGEVAEILDRTEKPVLVEQKSDYWYRLRTFDNYEGWAFGSYLAPAEKSRGSHFFPTNTTVLAQRLEEAGLTPSKYFKALVVVIAGTEREGFKYHPFDYQGTAHDRDNWWPASNVKIFSAVAMLEWLSAREFGPAAKITFKYEGKSHSTTVDRLLRKAITQSNNRSFDQTVEVVGCEWLNQIFLTARNGLRRTVLLRSYSHRVPSKDFPDEGTLRDSPPIVVMEDSRKKTLDARRDAGDYVELGCRGIEEPDQQRAQSREGNCTTPWELMEIMRRIMMHEHIPRSERFELSPDNLTLIREALAGDRERGNNVVEGLAKGLSKRALFHHKPGYAMKWMSDIVFVQLPETGERFIVFLADYPGRKALDEVSVAIGKILANGSLFRTEAPGDDDSQ